MGHSVGNLAQVTVPTPTLLTCEMTGPEQCFWSSSSKYES